MPHTRAHQIITLLPLVARLYDMNASFMQFQRHERGIHVV
jgi:hypothetical protein